MSSTFVRVNLGERGYDIAIGNDAWADLSGFVRRCWSGSRAVLVVDERTADWATRLAQPLADIGVQALWARVPAGESSKSLAEASRLWDFLADAGVDRATLIVAVGGGMVGDLAGFVAATYLRGLPFFIVPTTLLAMVDSAVGGKVGINHARGKNLIGAFHQPVGVWIELASLGTLPDREYRSGLAEVVKYGVILDAELFGLLERSAEAILRRDPELLVRVIARCCRLKAEVVERDERETSGLREVLNYGHTFAHAFETVGGYGSWLHGEAVAAGMVCAAALAERLGLAAAGLAARQCDLLARLGLPLRPDPAWPADRLVAAMQSDKKTLAGQLRFVLPTRIGEVRTVEGVKPVEVRSILEGGAD